MSQVSNNEYGFYMVTDNGLDALAAILHETAIEKGFWEGPKNHDKIGNKLALVHSEVTEVLEAIRKNKGSEEIVEEMSDVIIRLLDIYAAMRNEETILHSLDEILEKKININKERQLRHGYLFYCYTKGKKEFK
jgi:NTP pyrophosphatase (non-canonical NTP hydrolase)